MRFELLKFTGPEWRQHFAEDAHKIVFGKIRRAEWDRCDFAIYFCKEHTKEPLAYATARELDNESVYLQYGGAVREVRGTVTVARMYEKLLEMLASYKRITTYIENENVGYLRLAMAHGFRIIGTRFFDGEIYVELLREEKRKISYQKEETA